MITATITFEGVLVLMPENELEGYALKNWINGKREIGQVPIDFIVKAPFERISNVKIMEHTS